MNYYLLEKCVKVCVSKISLYEWFINQNHIPFMADELYHELYLKFLEDLYKLSLKSNGPYYWFGNNGKLINCNNSDVIDSNSICLNKIMLRDLKIDLILK